MRAWPWEVANPRSAIAGAPSCGESGGDRASHKLICFMSSGSRPWTRLTAMHYNSATDWVTQAHWSLAVSRIHARSEICESHTNNTSAPQRKTTHLPSFPLRLPLILIQRNSASRVWTHRRTDRPRLGLTRKQERAGAAEKSCVGDRTLGTAWQT